MHQVKLWEVANGVVITYQIITLVDYEINYGNTGIINEKYSFLTRFNIKKSKEAS